MVSVGKSNLGDGGETWLIPNPDPAIAFRSWEHGCSRAFGGPVPAIPTIALEAIARHDHGIETRAWTLGTRERWDTRPSLEDGGQVVDVVWKNLTARHHGHGSGAGAGIAGVGRRSSRRHRTPTSTAAGYARDEYGSAGASCTSATAAKRVSQPASVHADRPRCQLGWGFAAAFWNGLAELRTAGRPPPRSAYGEYALACAASGHGRAWWARTSLRDITGAAATASGGQRPDDVCRDGCSGCQARGEGKECVIM